MAPTVQLFASGSRLLTGFGLPASFRPLPARSASTPPGWERLHRLLITALINVHRPGLAPTPPDPECAPLAVASVARWTMGARGQRPGSLPTSLLL